MTPYMDLGLVYLGKMMSPGIHNNLKLLLMIGYTILNNRKVTTKDT